MNVDRIQRFIQLLKDDAANPEGVKFNMNCWAKPDGVTSHHNAYPTNAGVEVKVSCGTQACALGLAAISGIFKDEGLGYEIKIPDGGDLATTMGMLMPTFEGLREYSAGAAFFDINQHDAEMLFDNNNYRQRIGVSAELEVITRLEYLLQYGSLSNYIS